MNHIERENSSFYCLSASRCLLVRVKALTIMIIILIKKLMKDVIQHINILKSHKNETYSVNDGWVKVTGKPSKYFSLTVSAMQTYLVSASYTQFMNRVGLKSILLQKMILEIAYSYWNLFVNSYLLSCLLSANFPLLHLS